MKVYDCFCYFNEDLLLRLRLETLWNYVDYFVISEANYTHSGDGRQLHFDMTKFQKFASKIRYIPLLERPSGPNNFWNNENFIRNNISNGLFDALPEDLILISDLDEIPNPTQIKVYDTYYLRGDFEQRYYSYYFNNYWLGDVGVDGSVVPGKNFWYGSKITTYAHFNAYFDLNATSVRSYKSSGIFRSLRRAWFKKFKVQIIQNGGWHFTWIFTMKNILKKIESTAHQEFNKLEYKDPVHIEARIKMGRDFHKPNARYRAQVIDVSFPDFLYKNQDLFNEFILK